MIVNAIIFACVSPACAEQPIVFYSDDSLPVEWAGADILIVDRDGGNYNIVALKENEFLNIYLYYGDDLLSKTEIDTEAQGLVDISSIELRQSSVPEYPAIIVRIRVGDISTQCIDGSDGRETFEVYLYYSGESRVMEDDRPNCSMVRP